MSNSTTGRDSQSTPKDLAGKYLTFRLGNEEYGISILAVVEIIKMMSITAVPRAPRYVRGVINLRGNVIPVVELRGKFGMEFIADDAQTCIIVVNVESKCSSVQMGILVDTVSEVLDIMTNEIEPPPNFGASIETGFILGMAKARGAVKILLDINRIVSNEEIGALV